MARRPGIALGASLFIAGVTLLISGANFGKPLGWVTILTLFAGGLTSGMGIAKAKREWHDAWVRQTFGDVVLRAPHENVESASSPLAGQIASDSDIGDSAKDAELTDQVLRLPHDGPDTDVILSLPHGDNTSDRETGQ